MNEQAIVYVVDDDAGMRKSLQMLLESASLPTRVYESAKAFLAEADLRRPACLVLDLRMPHIGGNELLQLLKDLGAEMPVILISGHADVSAAVRGMKLGAIDLLEKPFEPQTLLTLVKKALQDSIALQQQRDDRERVIKRMATLTPRELELLKLVISGMSNKAIASHLKISIKTVANHRAHLMDKTAAVNGPDLVRLSVIAGM